MDEDRSALDVQVQCLKGRKGRRRYLSKGDQEQYPGLDAKLLPLCRHRPQR